jgi:hypothetical protein
LVWVVVVHGDDRVGATATTVEHFKAPGRVVMVAGPRHSGVEADVWIAPGDRDTVARSVLTWIREQNLVERCVVVNVDAGSLPVAGQIEALGRYFADPSVGAVEFAARPRRSGTSWLGRVVALDLTTVQPAYQAIRDDLGVLGLRQHRAVRATAWRDVLLRSSQPWSELGPALVHAGWRIRQHVFAAIEVDGSTRVGSLWRTRRREAAETLRAGRQVRALWSSGLADGTAFGSLAALARPWAMAVALLVGAGAAAVSLAAVFGLWGSAAAGARTLFGLAGAVVAPGLLWGAVATSRVGERPLAANLMLGAGLGAVRLLDASAALAALSGSARATQTLTRNAEPTLARDPANPAISRVVASASAASAASAASVASVAQLGPRPVGRRYREVGGASASDDAATSLPVSVQSVVGSDHVVGVWSEVS